MDAIELFEQAEVAWDAENYDEAIKKFDQCLCANPSPTVAMKAFVNIGVMIHTKYRFGFRKGESVSDEEARWVIRAGICGQKAVEIYNNQISNTQYAGELHELFVQAKQIHQFGTTYCLTKRDAYGQLDFRDLVTLSKINLSPINSIADEENRQLESMRGKDKSSQQTSSEKEIANSKVNANTEQNISEDSMFYLYKNNQQFGPYQESAVIDWIRNGQCSPSDLAIRGDMTDWQPLGMIFPMPVTTSGNLEKEFNLFEVSAEELEVLFSQIRQSDNYTAQHLLRQYEQKLQIMERQVFSLKNQFPNTDEVEFMESFFYVKYSGLKMEQNNWAEALHYLDRAINIIDTPNVRIVRASVYLKLNQKEQALQDLHHIITNPVEDEGLYYEARQMKDALEN